jgi:hypothetical protein
MTVQQSAFANKKPSDALDSFIRMSPTQQEDMRELMGHKAWSLTHSDSLTPQQKARNQDKLDRLGIEATPPPHKGKSVSILRNMFRRGSQPVGLSGPLDSLQGNPNPYQGAA